jgi:hypothetical protein
VVSSNGPALKADTFRASGDLYAGRADFENYTLQLQDDTGGFWRGTVTVTGPDGRTLTTDFAQSRVDGQETSSPCGTQCAVPVMFRKGLPEGQWAVTKLVLVDNAGVATTYNSGPVINVGDDTTLPAGDFTATPNPVNDWRDTVQVAVTTRVTGAQGGVKQVLLYSDCVTPSNSGTPNADGTYTAFVQMSYQTKSCTVDGIEVTDGSGKVALYGPHFSAPGDALVITQQPDTTPPAIRSASVDPDTVAHSQLATTLFKVRPSWRRRSRRSTTCGASSTMRPGTSWAT